MTNLAVDVVADIVCPWCYIGRGRLLEAARLLAPEITLELRHHPFELNPEMPEGGLDRRTYRTRKFGSWERSLELDARLQSVAAADGLPLDLARQERTPSSFKAHRLLGRLGDRAQEAALLDALYHAYFVDGRDIGSTDVLVYLAGSVGIEGDAARAFLDGQALGAEVRAAVDAAYGAGISGVPAVVAKRTLVAAGAEEAHVLAERLRQLAAA